MAGPARSAMAMVGLGLAVIGGAVPAMAGSDNGNFMVRALGTVVDPDSEATVSAGGAVIPGADADVSTEVIPALTLTYFFNNNLAVELFCCFAKHEIDGKGTIAAFGEIADTWIFPPALTLQYHFAIMGSFKPYVGAGGFIHRFLRHRHWRQCHRRDQSRYRRRLGLYLAGGS